MQLLLVGWTNIAADFIQFDEVRFVFSGVSSKTQ